MKEKNPFNIGDKVKMIQDDSEIGQFNKSMGIKPDMVGICIVKKIFSGYYLNWLEVENEKKYYHFHFSQLELAEI